MKAAVAELRKQVPLGSTDMVAALAKAVGQLNSVDGVQRRLFTSVTASALPIYSTRQPSPKAIDQLRATQASVSSFAVGPRLDSQLLAVLANQSGGNLTIQQNEGDLIRNAQLAGKDLIATVNGKVMWPTEAQLPAEMGQYYPSAVPPLRSDRDTIIWWVQLPTKLPASLDLEIKAGNETFKWSTTRGNFADDMPS